MRFSTGTLADLTTALNAALVELSAPITPATGTLASATNKLNGLLVWHESTLPPASGTLASAVITYNHFVIRYKIDSRLSALWANIQDAQTAYYATHGHYWQGLRTHSAIPANGGETEPDIGATTPTDQPDAWPGALIASALPMALSIDAYDGPAGRGYIAHVYVQVAGNVYTRSAQVGAETWRVHGWRPVVTGTGQ
jgi:hypothetical protein